MIRRDSDNEVARNAYASAWPSRPVVFGDLLTPVEAAQYLRLDETGQHGPDSAIRTLNYWRDRGDLIRECRRILREAIECSLIRSNPSDGIRQEKVGQIAWQHINAEHFRALIGACTSLKWRGMITLAYCCGLRQGEILNLTWSDVDFECQLVRVVRKPATGTTKAWCPKDKDMRLVPLPAQAVNVLTELQLAAGDGQQYVVVNGNGPDATDRVKRQNVTRDFRVICRRGGVPRCKFHDLRKSYCTNIAQVTPLHVIQQLAGHADIRTTQKHYLQVQPELIDAARRAVEEVLK